jgi:acetylornithine deacetylase
VLDVKVKGTPSHAAHQNEDNAIYKTIPVMEWFKTINSQDIRAIRSRKMTVTQINAGKQHNVVPSECDLVIDIRVNDCYSNPRSGKEHVDAEVTPRPCT